MEFKFKPNKEIEDKFVYYGTLRMKVKENILEDDFVFTSNFECQQFKNRLIKQIGNYFGNLKVRNPICEVSIINFKKIGTRILK